MTVTVTDGASAVQTSLSLSWPLSRVTVRVTGGPGHPGRVTVAAAYYGTTSDGSHSIQHDDSSLASDSGLFKESLAASLLCTLAVAQSASARGLPA